MPAYLDPATHEGLTRGEYAAFKQSKDVERLREIGITFPKSI